MPDTLSRDRETGFDVVSAQQWMIETAGSGDLGRKHVAALLRSIERQAAHIDALTAVLREAIEAVHQTGSIRDHADPNDKTGWNVHGIETCADPLCVDALALLDRP